MEEPELLAQEIRAFFRPLREIEAASESDVEPLSPEVQAIPA